MPPVPPDPQGPYRLLMIDDDEDEYILMRALVEESTALASIEWVSDLEAAEKHLLQEGHDCYLLDHYMGVTTGVELMRSAREKGCRAPIIILTGYTSNDGDIDIDALQAGATDYLEKSQLTAASLQRAVRYAVHQQANQNHLEDLVQQITHLEALKTDMIRIAAHDLRNPLTVMIGYIEMLDEDTDSGAAHQSVYLQKLRDSVRHMQKMVGDILSVERIAEMSGGQTDPLDFSALIRQAFERYQSDVHEMKLELPPQPITVYGQAALLREALDNLLSNAVKYTPANGQITVNLSADADFALLRVIDTGYGIPEESQDRLFSPFFRARTQETRRINGTGLGLHIVKNIVERHNGTVYFESEYGKGSSFGFMLPQLNEDA